MDKLENAAHFDIEPEDILGLGKTPARTDAVYVRNNEWYLESE